MKPIAIVASMILALAVVFGASFLWSDSSFLIGNKQARTVSPEIRSLFVDRFGKNYNNAVNFDETVPNGLIKDGKLYPLPGSEQSLRLYSNLSENDLTSLQAAVLKTLKESRDSTFIPIKIEIYSMKQGTVFDPREPQVPNHTIHFGAENP